MVISLKKIDARKGFLGVIFVLILLVIALLVGKATYSYFTPQEDDDAENAGYVTAAGDTLVFTKGADLSLSATSDNFTTGGSNLTATSNPKVKLVKGSAGDEEASATYYAGIIINSNNYTYSTSDKKAEVLLTVKDENGNVVTSSSDALTYTTSGGVSGFDITGKTGIYNIVIKHPITTTSSSTGTTHTWTFILTFVNLSTDQSINENASLSMKAVLYKDRITPAAALTSGTLAYKIASVYTGVQGENNLYYHDSTLTDGAGDGSIRYSGASDSVNNYVCFGSTASTCPDDNLYRIIGVFENKVKLIKATAAPSSLLGTDGDFKSGNTYYWNYRGDTVINGGTGSNDWSSSLLNKTNLNTNYINKIGSTWSRKIATTAWQVGGADLDMITTAGIKNMYTKEMTTNASMTYSAKIGLMYASDYGFATSPKYWSLPASENVNYNDISQGKNENWLYNGGSYEWIITPYIGRMDSAFDLGEYGNVSARSAVLTGIIRPAFFLDSSVKYSSGSGTSSSPYRIS